MKSIIKIVMISSCLFLSTISTAANPTQVFGSCLVENLNGKEKKLLAKWIFFAIAAHPEIQSFSKITATDVTENDKYIGGLVTRLLADDCPVEMKAAYLINPQAIEQAFELVGQVAMQELMTNQAVTSSISSYINYTDQEKINNILSVE